MDDLKQAGILKFEFLGEPEIMEVHVFTTEKFKGTPTESEGKNIGTFIHFKLLWPIATDVNNTMSQ